MEGGGPIDGWLVAWKSTLIFVILTGGVVRLFSHTLPGVFAQRHLPGKQIYGLNYCN